MEELRLAAKEAEKAELEFLIALERLKLEIEKVIKITDSAGIC